MAKIISVHSFRGGTGKSNTTANVATVFAQQGYRVGVVDTDIQSPGIHILFGLEGDEVSLALNDYLWHDVSIEDIALDVTDNVDPDLTGRIFLIPSSVKPGEITRVLKEGYNAKKFSQGLRSLIDSLSLDFLLIDTHPGLNEETLLSLVLSNVLLVVMRPDKQDYEGTGITVEVAKQLEVPKMMLVVNKTPPSLSAQDVAQQVEAAYSCPVAAVLPHSVEMMELASYGIFSIHYPEHPVTALYHQIVERII